MVMQNMHTDKTTTTVSMYHCWKQYVAAITSFQWQNYEALVTDMKSLF